MKQNDLEQISVWFEQYVGLFLRGDSVTKNVNNRLSRIDCIFISL